MKPRKKLSNVTWFLDECITPSKTNWESISKSDVVYTAADLNLKSTEDSVISEAISSKFPDGVIILTKNIHVDKKGDYFKKLSNIGLIRFSPSILTNEEQSEVLKKFKEMVPNSKKILGKSFTLHRGAVTFMKGGKLKTIKYDKYVI